MSTQVDLRRKGRVYGSAASDSADAFRDKVNVEPYGAIAFGPAGMGFGHRWLAALENFELLPAGTVAAGTAKLVAVTGTDTEVIARAVKGGVRLSTDATTIATNDVMIAGVATSGHAALVNTTSQVHFHCALSLPVITTIVAVAGMRETVTAGLPTDEVGDGVFLMFDPTESLTTGLTTAQHANWIIVQVIAGAELYTATTVAVNADQVYDFKIRWNEDMIPQVWIDDVLVGAVSDFSAQTASQTLRTHIGIEATSTVQLSIDIGFAEVSRALD